MCFWQMCERARSNVALVSSLLCVESVFNSLSAHAYGERRGARSHRRATSDRSRVRRLQSTARSTRVLGVRRRLLRGMNKSLRSNVRWRVCLLKGVFEGGPKVSVEMLADMGRTGSLTCGTVDPSRRTPGAELRYERWLTGHGYGSTATAMAQRPRLRLNGHGYGSTATGYGSTATGCRSTAT